METFEVSRHISYDYMLLVPALAAIFNLYLIQQKKWKELLVFNIAGLVNVTAEIYLVSSGIRKFDTGSDFQKVVIILCLGWVTNGFLFAIAYIDVRQWLKKLYPRNFVITANLIFFAGLPLANINYGMLDGAVRTWRVMGHSSSHMEPVALAILAAAIFLLGYRGLLWRLLLIGFLIDLHFEGRLFLFGIRPMSQFDFLRVAGRVLFEMNIALCLGFLILKGIFKLEDYKDKNQN